MDCQLQRPFQAFGSAMSASENVGAAGSSPRRHRRHHSKDRTADCGRRSFIGWHGECTTAQDCTRHACTPQTS